MRYVRSALIALASSVLALLVIPISAGILLVRAGHIALILASVFHSGWGEWIRRKSSDCKTAAEREK